MGLKSCSIKYLKNAYIGVSVRLTSGKGTTKFENIPLSDVEIVNYSSQGFQLKHPDLPKVAWLDFGQLPLKQLTIVNGIIKDEITFVENIIAHQTEFVKTDSDEYKTALSEFQLDSKLVLLPPSKLAIGDKVISAQCKESIELMFLGVFFSTMINPVYPTEIDRSNYYDRKKTDYTADPVFRLSDEPVEKRAFFLRLHDIDENSKYNLKLMPVELKKHIEEKFPEPKYNHMRDWNLRQEEIKQRNLRVNEEILSWCEERNITHVFELVRYPVTNKYVKEMMVVGKSDEHSTFALNCSLINSIMNFERFTGEFGKEKLATYTQSFFYSYADREPVRLFVHDKKKEMVEKANDFLKSYYGEQNA